MKTITEERRVVTFDEAASILGYTPRSIRVLFYKMKKQNGSAPKIVKKDGRTAYYDLDELLLHLRPPVPKCLVDTSKAAKILKVTPNTLIGWRRNDRLSARPPRLPYVMIQGIYYYHLNDLSAYQNELDAQYYLTMAQAAEIMDMSEEDLIRLTRMKNKKGEHAIVHRVVDGEYRYRLKDLNVYKRKCLSGKALRLPKIEMDRQQKKYGKITAKTLKKEWVTEPELVKMLGVSVSCPSFWRTWDTNHGLPPRIAYRQENGRHYYLKSDALEYKKKGKKSRKNWRKTIIVPRKKLQKFWKHIRQCWGTGDRLTATAISKTGFPTFAAATGYIIGEKTSMLTKKSWRKRKTEMPGYKTTAKSRYFN